MASTYSWVMVVGNPRMKTQGSFIIAAIENERPAELAFRER